MDETPNSTPNAPVSKFIKDAFQGLGMKKSAVKPTTSRSALGAFAEIMGDKITKQMDAEKERLSFEMKKYEDEKLATQRRLEIEVLKVRYKHESLLKIKNALFYCN